MGAIPVEAAGLDFLTSPARSGSAGRTRRGRWSLPTPSGCAWPLRAFSRRRATRRTGASCPGPVRCASSRTGGRSRRSRGFSPRSTLGPPWAFDRAAEAAARCRALLASRARSWTRARARRSSPSGPRGSRPSSSRHSSSSGVHVREIPRTGLLRASCGWWTSDDDLDRLVAALPAVRREGRLPLRRGSLRRRRAAARRDRVSLRIVPRGDTGGPWAASAAHRSDLTVVRRVRSRLGTSRGLRAGGEPGQVPGLRNDRLLGRAGTRDRLVRSLGSSPTPLASTSWAISGSAIGSGRAAADRGAARVPPRSTGSGRCLVEGMRPGDPRGEAAPHQAYGDGRPSSRAIGRSAATTLAMCSSSSSPRSSAPA